MVAAPGDIANAEGHRHPARMRRAVLAATLVQLGFFRAGDQGADVVMDYVDGTVYHVLRSIID